MKQKNPRLKTFFQSKELPEIKEDDPRVSELRQALDRMPDALEKVFNLSADPRKCVLASMAVAQYLREEGYDARIMPVFYTKTHPLTKKDAGLAVALKSRLHTNLFSMRPLHQRDPKQFSRKMGSTPEEQDYLYKQLYMAEDTFVRVKFGEKVIGGEYYMIHPTYHQFASPKKQDKIPPIILDRVDAKKLRKKYHLVLPSPNTVSRLRFMERAVFTEDVNVESDDEFLEFRRNMRQMYKDFKAELKK